MRGVLRCFFAVMLLLLCAPALHAAALGQGGGRAQLLPADKAPLIIATAAGRQSFVVEIARTEAEKARGLMYRRIFPKNRAMLFVFAKPQPVVMWMKNTPLPLDMLFADDKGKILSVYEGAKPFSPALISSRHFVSYAAELNAGTVRAAGIKTGQLLLHPIICGKCAAAD